jgi:hypothetical protein
MQVQIREGLSTLSKLDRVAARRRRLDERLDESLDTDAR